MPIPLPVPVAIVASTIAEPVIAAVASVPSYRIWAVETHDPGIAWRCQKIHATVCASYHRFSHDPGAAARELAQAMQTDCEAAGGASDDPSDIKRFGTIGTGLAMTRLGGVHMCHVEGKLSGMTVDVREFGTVVDAVQPGPISQSVYRLIGAKRSRYEALTTAIDYTFADLETHRAELIETSIASCREHVRAAIREGARTDTGLVVEVRSRVALVQPSVGAAVWRSIDELKPTNQTPCMVTDAETMAGDRSRDLGPERFTSHIPSAVSRPDELSRVEG